MQSRVLMVLSCLTLTLSSACNFSFGFPDTNKANKLGADAQVLRDDAAKLRDEAMAKFKKLIDDSPGWEEWIKIEAPLKEQVAQIEKSQAKYKEAIQKSEEVSTLKVAESLKQYHAARANLFRKELELTDAKMQLAKAAYDPTIETEDDFVKKANEINAKLDSLIKEIDELSAKLKKVVDDHPDEFVK